MNSDFRLAVNFASHPKLIRLRRRLGADAAFGWVCLLAHVAANRPDGVLTAMDEEDIAIAAQYPDDAGKFVQMLLDLHLLDDVDGVRQVHDWADWNPWAAKASQRSREAREAAHRRWEGIDPAERSAQARHAARGRWKDHDASGMRASRTHDAYDPHAECEQNACSSLLFSSLIQKESRGGESPERGRKNPERGEQVAATTPLTLVAIKTASPPVKPCARRLPDDFALTAERARAATSLGIDSPNYVFEKFCDYWRAIPGAKGTKLDWDGTWRNWCRVEVERGGGVRPKTTQSANAPRAPDTPKPNYRPMSEVLAEQRREDAERERLWRERQAKNG